jgi:hypothetical protein
MPPKYKIEFSSGQTKGILNLVCLLEVKLWETFQFKT